MKRVITLQQFTATCLLLLMVLMSPASVFARQQRNHVPVSIESADAKLTVWVGEGGDRQMFTEYRFQELAKPVLYPVFAPGQVSMTRNYPMKTDDQSEAHDHPHHKSIWFAHGDVNGVDFWAEKATIRHQSIDLIEEDQFTVSSNWMNDDSLVCQDQTTIQFSAGNDWRMIDYRVQIHAAEQDVVFGDTKEGTFAMRTHPSLRLVGRDGKPVGSAVNSEGDEGRDLWGKKARWVHYRGDIDGRQYSITMLDHPDNFRHPTTWHAREYGLVAANPFGLRHFQNAKPGTGTHVLPAGESMPFRYAILIHRGKLSSDEINARFDEFATGE